MKTIVKKTIAKKPIKDHKYQLSLPIPLHERVIRLSGDLTSKKGVSTSYKETILMLIEKGLASEEYGQSA